ncbi:MAG: ATP-binding protein [Dehalococcoidia bacterium]
MSRQAEAWELFATGLLQVEAVLRRVSGVPPRDLAGVVIDDAEVDRILRALPGLDGPGPDELDATREDLTSRLDILRAQFRVSLAAREDSPFVTLAYRAGLTADEAEVFALLAAIEVEPSRQRLLAYVQDHAGATRPWLATVDAMFPAPHAGVRALGPSSHLARAEYTRVDAEGPWGTRPVSLHEDVAWALRGGTDTPADLPLRARIEEPPGIETDGEQFVVVSGADRVSRMRVVHRETAGSRFLVSAPPSDAAGWRSLVRTATVHGMTPVLEVDGEVSAEAAHWIERATHLAWAISSAKETALESLPARPWVEHRALVETADADDWRASLGRDPEPRHRLDREQLRLVGAAYPAVGQDLDAAVRRLASGHLDSLAVRIQPSRGWDDLVLPPHQHEQLLELVSRYRYRGRVYDEWGYSPSPSMGIVALFAGQSGTGKTLAAEVIARDLGLDLYKIDLSSVVSKYIGETEKNLERIFTAAGAANLVLFFDEADAIFGKRSEVSDAHDRYANIEVAYLLQRLELYDGLVVMATNLQGNIDQAFLRRIHVAVDFPLPEEDERRTIWERCFPAGAPREALDTDFLAHQFKVTGGVIRNASLAAGFYAAEAGGPISMDLVLRGMEREFEKMGRLRSAGDFASYQPGGQRAPDPNGADAGVRT